MALYVTIAFTCPLSLMPVDITIAATSVAEALAWAERSHPDQFAACVAVEYRRAA